MLKQLFSAIALFVVFYPIQSNSQVVPDNTLGTESSVIRSIDELKDAIEGGAIRGDNLFHSFEQFGIDEGFTIEFANPEGISNIFSRVTGGNISEIFGTLGVDGNANLFLMNPNGIVFGENAAINIGGSFLATTAESVEFNSGDRFSAVGRDKPLLTIDFPIGLGLGSSSGEIRVEGTGNELFFTSDSSIQNRILTGAGESTSGLRVQPNRNIALIGKNVTVDGGLVTAPSGNIDIGSIKSGRIIFNLEEWNFDYTEVSVFEELRLDNQALLDTSGISGGNITLVGSLIDLDNGATIFIESQAASNAKIAIDAKESLSLSGKTTPTFSSDPFQQAFEETATIATSNFSGAGIDIEISTKNLEIENGASILTISSLNGSSGNIKISSSDLVQISGASETNPLSSASSIFTLSRSLNTGTSGNIQIEARNLFVEDGAGISTSAIGTRSGNISLDISESILIRGTRTIFSGQNEVPSSINTAAQTFSPIENSFSRPNAGEINVNTSVVEILDGGSISTSSTGSANAGRITVNASESVTIEGFVETQGEGEQTIFPSLISSSTLVLDPILQELLNLPAIPTGNADSVEINTDKLFVENTASVAVLNQGTGDGGNLQINADSISLNDAGSISASTVSGEGGNVTINSNNLELFNQSNIAANAGELGNGGNITIDSDTILGLNNSDITANAFRGNGGNITINSDFIVGLEEQPELTFQSDITASSEFGIDGTVTINSLETSVEEDLIISARGVDLTEARELLERDCTTGGRRGRNQLVYLGAGIRQSPDNFFDDTPIVDERTIIKTPVPTEKSNDVPPLWSPGDPIIQPNAVQINPDGRKFLVAVEEIQSPESAFCSPQNTDPEAQEED